MKIGITGNIGAGKTTFAGFILERGFKAIDADSVAKKIMVEEIVIRDKIKSAFGVEAYYGEELNSEYIAEKVFKNKSALKTLNSIVHPALKIRLKNIMELEEKRNDYVFVDAALIYEAGMESLFDKIVLLVTEKNDLIERTVKRDNTSAREVLDRLSKQISPDLISGKADYIIRNDGDIDNLRAETEKFFAWLESSN